MPRKNSCSEKQTETSILQYLEARKIFCWKQNTVGIYDKSKGIYRSPRSKYVIKGVADILGVYNGKLLAIEVKAVGKKKNTTEFQDNFLRRVRESGGIAFVATSISDVEYFLNKEING